MLHARKERTRDELVQLPEVRGVAEDVADLPVNATVILPTLSLHHYCLHLLKAEGRCSRMAVPSTAGAGLGQWDYRVFEP